MTRKYFPVFYFCVCCIFGTTFASVISTPVRNASDFNSTNINNEAVLGKTYSELKSMEPEARIIGGQNVTNPELFPYVVSIQQNGVHKCGGTILDAQHVITSALCLENVDPKQLNVSAGHLQVHEGKKNTEGGQYYIVKDVYKNADFNKKTYENDIAVLKLTEKLTWSETIQPAIIRVLPFEIRNANCFVLGWGQTKNLSVSVTLKKLSVTVQDFETCKFNYKSVNVKMTDDTFCAGVFDASEGACLGDEGGPLICNDQLSGVLSYFGGCGIRKYPGLYMNVSRYLDWIDAAEKSLENGVSRFSFVYYTWSLLFVIILLV